MISYKESVSEAKPGRFIKLVILPGGGQAE